MGFLVFEIILQYQRMLVRLETGTPRRHARNLGPLAPRRVPTNEQPEEFVGQIQLWARMTPLEQTSC